eukprot:COSAG04_NODE_26099_length_299_cov_1.025000_1_plen_51_part_10
MQVAPLRADQVADRLVVWARRASACQQQGARTRAQAWRAQIWRYDARTRKV